MDQRVYYDTRAVGRSSATVLFSEWQRGRRISAGLRTDRKGPVHRLANQAGHIIRALYATVMVLERQQGAAKAG